MLSTELRSHEIPNIFSRFRDIIEERYWLKRVSQLKSETRGNPFLRRYLQETDDLAFGLAKCSEQVERYGLDSLQRIDKDGLLPALSIVEQSTHNNARALVGRIRGALKNPEDARALRLELSAATHFVRKGHRVSWPETEGNGNFDLLVEGLNDVGLEVECKSISRNKGHKIHDRDARDFHSQLAKQLEPFRKSVTQGIAVVLTVSDRLPASPPDKKRLAIRVKNTVLSACTEQYEDGTTVRVSEFDVKLLTGARETKNHDLARPLIDKITGTRNRQGVVYFGDSPQGAIVFVLQSAKDDSYLFEIFATLAKSAANQMTQQRPGLFVVGIDGLSAKSLLEIGEQDFDSSRPPTGLRVELTQFFSSLNRDHLIGTAFESQGELEPIVHESTGDHGFRRTASVYYFPRLESRFWSKAFEGMFSEVST